MEIAEIKKLSDKELNEKLAELRDGLRGLRFQFASGDLKKVRNVRSTRKLIAQVLTEINSRKSTALSAQTK
jgi:ribosomal protein L29